MIGLPRLAALSTHREAVSVDFRASASASRSTSRATAASAKTANCGAASVNCCLSSVAALAGRREDGLPRLLPLIYSTA